MTNIFFKERSGSHLKKVRPQTFKKALIDPLTMMFCIITLVFSTEVYAQSANKTVKGLITDSKGIGLPSVNVIIKGTNIGVFADLDGNYLINIPAQSEQTTLRFSFMGYQEQEIEVGNRSEINISLIEEVNKLDAVVVTALGIKKASRSLTYNVQELKSDQLTKIKDASFVNSLSGKVAGLTINQNSSGVGGSTRVIMRGAKSLFGNNNALYVVDGIPLPDLKSKQTTDQYGGEDGGDGISSINPDDIESLSVLTGPAAAALYGGIAANGVVLITTKRGVSGKLKVNISNSTNFFTPMILPQLQTTYGATVPNSFGSWGKKLDEPSSYSPADFFQTGYNTTNSISVLGGSDKNQTYVSASTLNSEGIVDNNIFDRYNLTFRNTSALIEDKLVLDFSFMYVKQKQQNMRGQGEYRNPLFPIYLFPASDNIDKYKVFERYNPDRNFKTQYWTLGDNGTHIENPWWQIYREIQVDNRQRFLPTATLKYTISDWINVTARVKFDKTMDELEQKFHASSNLLWSGPQGSYHWKEARSTQTYADVIANINRNFGADFVLTANVGSSILDLDYVRHGFGGHLNIVPNKFQFDNIHKLDYGKDEEKYHDQSQALFANAQLAYKNKLFLDVTGRNEWLSALYGTTQSSVFYPSIGLSGIINEWAQLPQFITFAKLRASYSEVGNPPQVRYVSNPTAKITNSGFPETMTDKSLETLKPERTQSYEFGADIRLFNSALILNLTYYNSYTKNQLFRYKPPISTGFAQIYVNGGKVQNYGFEGSLSYQLNQGDFKWTPSAVLSSNRNKIIELVPPGIDDSKMDWIQSQAGGYAMKLKAGGSMSDIYTWDLKKDEQGYIITRPGETTNVMVDQNFTYTGRATPDFNMGLSNTFQYKRISLNVLVDGRFGGIVVSGTQAVLDKNGTSKTSADLRETELMLNGAPAPRGYTVQEYLEDVGGIDGALRLYTYSATNVRLKEISLSYSLGSLFNNTIKNVNLSVNAKNLFFLYNKAPHDPEASSSADTYYQGFDYFMMPSLRNLGFNINITL